MRALDRKLARDLVRLRGQVLTIALVVAAGVSAWVCLRSTYESLRSTRDAYDETSHVGDVFAHLERAPRAVQQRLAAIDGVRRVRTRLLEFGAMPLESGAAPARARVLSLPDPGEPPLDAVTVLRGRLPDPTRPGEALLVESFARAHRLGPGAALRLVLDGRERRVRVVGIAMSPAFVYATEGNALESEGQSAVIWMSRRALEAASGQRGVFDDVIVELVAGASTARVRAAVDAVLAPYGGHGASERDEQPSHALVAGELGQLRAFSTVAPLLFLAVAAFLVHLVVGRLVQRERGAIAVLGALGYGPGPIARHYLAFVLAITGLGALAGVGLGVWLGRRMLALYVEFFRFPMSAYRASAPVVLLGVAFGMGAALVGTALTVRRILRAPLAASLRPEPPARYRASPLGRRLAASLLDTPSRLIVREIVRRPARAALSIVGVAFASAVLVVGRFSHDAIEALIDRQFERAMREDVEVRFARPLSTGALRALRGWPGVLAVEPARELAGRVRVGHRARAVAVVAHAPGARLRVALDALGRPIDLPAGGATLTTTLAEVLGLRPGATFVLEPLEGARRPRVVRLAATLDEPYGLSVHLTEDALAAILDEPARASGGLLRVDPRALATLERRLARLPAVVSVARRRARIAQFRALTGRTMGSTTTTLTAFAVAIAIGVVYNHARVALSSRARDLATLRVLGFSRGEVSAVLLGEIAVHVILAMPLGALLGQVLSDAVLATVDAERYRLRADLTPRTHAFAMTVSLAAAVASAWLVRARVDRLDLRAALEADA